ncbi:MAG TPA: hypothetical protein DEA08_26420 [Planctomycetes bacterium]|nr:hypothetical protein [Planctomycetota bacterium]|tara:strand:+ start:126 stop:755 length:630 start_codon:yes stop_codon:yes gene_type:complete
MPAARKTRTRPRKRLSAAERRTQTLERVTRLFAERGFSGTTTADLARAAGVSEAMLYKLFGSKEGIYQAMVEHKLAHAGWGEFPADPELAPREFFRGLALRIFERVEADPDFVRLLHYSDLQGGRFAELFHAAMGEAVLESVGAYVAGQAAGGVLRADLDPQLAGASFLCTCWHWAVARKVFQTPYLTGVADEQVITTLVSLFLEGVQA